MPDAANQFNKSWKLREESLYNHWTPNTPANQIQLAFKNHWDVFKGLIGNKSGICLEVGCGRGSISSYFAENGYVCHLLDYSQEILLIGREIFKKNGHKGLPVCGDALNLPYKTNSFDVVVSIGLLEHFENVSPIISEQLRVLKKNGIMLAYIVPDMPNNIQKHFNWINKLLKIIFFVISKQSKKSIKPEIYRNNYIPQVYLDILDKFNIKGALCIGMYPLPMISHSPEFPFSLLPEKIELALTNIFNLVLWLRRIFKNGHPWNCKYDYGQAFLIYFTK
ncbi:MAG: class I SAM-dependent methyltransferase [Nitrospirae bacterium]|nr:class I SAM-dependent methyltransferase [Nitrospirota bacterium]